MRFNNSTQKPRSQLPRLLRFWLGQPAGQTRSLAPRVWGQSVGPNSSIPIAGAAHPLLTVYDHFHSVFHLKLFYFTVKACGLSSRLALGRGNLELSIVFFFCQSSDCTAKREIYSTLMPQTFQEKIIPLGGEFRGRFPEMFTRSSLDLDPCCFALVSYTTRTSFFFLFQVFKAPHFGPTLWPHTLPPPPRIDFRRRASFWQVTSSPAKHIAVARTGGDPARRGRANSRGREEETEVGEEGEDVGRLPATCARLHLGWTSLAA